MVVAVSVLRRARIRGSPLSAAFGRGWAASPSAWQRPPPPGVGAAVPREVTLARGEATSAAPEPMYGGRRPSPRLLGALALLRSPEELDGEGLGKAATAAAREGLDDSAWWDRVTARAKELVNTLALHDAALILNGMARTRRLNKSLVEALLPRICSHLMYLTSAHLAMLSSAIAKAEVHNPRFVGLLTRELKARLVEFHSPMEITMIVNSMSKLRVTDEDLYKRLVIHIQNRMGREAFHVRDIAVIVSALARVQCADAATINRFAEAAVETLPQATPLELARLMHACASVGCTANDFFEACSLHCRDLTPSMDPAGLSAAAFAFGQCFEVAEVAHLPCLRRIFRYIRVAAVASLPLFLPREIVSLLRTYARWQVTFECERLHRVADRMSSLSSKFEPDSSVAALYSLVLLMQRNVARSAGGASASCAAAWVAASVAADCLLEPVWDAARAGQLDAQTILRAVEASVVLQPSSKSPIAAVSAVVAFRRVELDRPTRVALVENLSELGCPADGDLMLVLSEGLY